jgi:hypothetical protein
MGLELRRKFMGYPYEGPQKGYMLDSYPGYNMLNVPTIAGKEPLEVALFLDRLAEETSRTTFWPTCAKYFWRGDGKLPTKGYRKLYQIDYISSVYNLGRHERVYQAIGKREDVKSLRKLLEAKSRMGALTQLVVRHCGGASWQWCLVTYYLLARACDLARFGQQVADISFPQPTLTGVSAKEVSDTVASLSAVFEAEEARKITEENAPWLVKFEGNVTENFNKWLSVRTYPKPPAYLPSRTLTRNDIDEVKKVCLRELSGSSVLTVITDVVNFCDLLARPENHVKVPSNQYTETQVNLYTTQEMVNQMEQELLDLRPPFAYVKSAWKGKLATLAFAPMAYEALVDMRSGARENAITQGLLKPRSEVEAEIRQRQEAWRQEGGPGSLPSPPTTGGGSAPPALPAGGSGGDGTPSPPTSYTPTKPKKPPGKKSLPVEFVSLRFYESGTWLPEHERRYSDRFSHHSARFVNVVLTMASTLTVGQSKQRVKVKIQYLKPDEDTLAGYEDTLDVRPDTPEPWYHWGIGSPNPGYWKPGRYRVVIFIDGVAFAEAAFTIREDGGMVEQIQPPKSESLARPQGRIVDFTSYQQKRGQTKKASPIPLTESPVPLSKLHAAEEAATAPAAPFPSVSCANSLEVTLSNPHYARDLRLLDGEWDLTEVMNGQTIIIVTGIGLEVELLDRPVAERLRDEIDKRGDITRGQRAIVVTDALWFNDTNLHTQPVIAVGGPSPNALTHMLAHEGDKWQTPEGFEGSFIEGPPPQVSLWGQESAHVHDHVEAWIKNPNGLSYFLRLCWQ